MSGPFAQLFTSNHVDDLILYDNTAEPPLYVGGSKSNTASPSVPAHWIFDGTHGTVTGITLLDARLNVPVPMAVLAATVNV